MWLLCRLKSSIIIQILVKNVGWAVSQSPAAKLAKAALNNANKKHRPNFKNLMFHSDQGVQYSANLFTSHLVRLKITQSMSRRGNCWDTELLWNDFLEV